MTGNKTKTNKKCPALRFKTGEAWLGYHSSSLCSNGLSGKRLSSGNDLHGGGRRGGGAVHIWLLSFLLPNVTNNRTCTCDCFSCEAPTVLPPSGTNRWVAWMKPGDCPLRRCCFTERKDARDTGHNLRPNTKTTSAWVPRRRSHFDLRSASNSEWTDARFTLWIQSDLCPKF